MTASGQRPEPRFASELFDAARDCWFDQVGDDLQGLEELRSQDEIIQSLD